MAGSALVAACCGCGSWRAANAAWLRWLRGAACGLLAGASLAGCGFHLQGAGGLPAGTRQVYLATADELTPFAIELRKAIERAGGGIAPRSGAADTVIRIRHDRTGRRVLSVSASNTPQEYEVFYAVEYTVDRAGKEVLDAQPLELIRTLSFDDSELLAKDREEAILRDAMARDLALLVMRRLESLPAIPAPVAGAASGQTAPAAPAATPAQ